ncbi:hypothetical protein TWF696_003789 [Orbilia brochopaga]|uniref:Amidohydrolase 3 domain-containing protein n=1 Tax=Orbilia brochopaga TaxID=3140254 RepID=A0AAV9V5D7_9PEZI
MSNGKLSAVEALAIKDGKVLATGPLLYLKNITDSSRELRDIGDNIILPGFVEPHLHIMLSALLKGYLLDISPLRTPTFEAAIAALNAELPNVKPGQWLFAHGYDPSRLDWHDLSMKSLDKEVSSTVPILIINASGHLAYANSKAFALANVTQDTPDPEGGEYARDSSGKLTGVLVEAGAISPFAAIGEAANIARMPLIKDGLKEVLSQWLEKGVTTVLDAGLGLTALTEFDLIANLTECSPIRIFGAVADYKPDDAQRMLGSGPMPSGGFKKKNLTVRTVKLFSDGSTQGFTAAVKQDYRLEHFPAYFNNRTKGVLVWPDANQVDGGRDGYNTTLREEMLKWMQRGYQIMVHSNGDRSSQVVMDAYEDIFAAYPELHPRRSGIIHRIEHFTVTERSQIRRAGKLGLGVSHTMGHVYYWGNVFRNAVLGRARGERVDPVADDAAYDLVYSFNSDSPVTDVNPLLWVFTAITRRIFKTADTLGRSQGVNLERALRGVTSNPAKQILHDNQVGTLEAGKQADFIMLGGDLRRFNWKNGTPDEIPRVLETWIGGIRRFLYTA